MSIRIRFGAIVRQINRLCTRGSDLQLICVTNLTALIDVASLDSIKKHRVNRVNSYYEMLKCFLV